MYARSHTVRPAAHAGDYYPRDSLILSNTLERLVRRARPRMDLAPKALIVPHSPFRRSGPIAAAAFGTLLPARNSINRVVVIGPAHFAGFSGMVVPSFDGFATPIGEVPVDEELVEIALECEGVSEENLPHIEEHCIEAELPFIQHLLPEAAILPVTVARVPAWTLSDLLERVWGGPETLIVISTDLSHHLRYDEAVTRDRATADAIVTRDSGAFGPDDACGYYALQAFLHAAERRLLRGHLLNLRNSTDITGEESDIVGFGGFVFEEPVSPPPESIGWEPRAEDRPALAGRSDPRLRVQSALVRADVLTGRAVPRGRYR